MCMACILAEKKWIAFWIRGHADIHRVRNYLDFFGQGMNAAMLRCRCCCGTSNFITYHWRCHYAIFKNGEKNESCQFRIRNDKYCFSTKRDFFETVCTVTHALAQAYTTITYATIPVHPLSICSNDQHGNRFNTFRPFVKAQGRMTYVHVLDSKTYLENEGRSILKKDICIM